MNFTRVLVVLLFLFTPYVLAEEGGQDGVGSARHALGFSAGSAAGPGISYRRYFSRSYLQGNIFTRIRQEEGLSDLFAGVSYGRILSEISTVKALPPTALVLVGGVDGRYSDNQTIDATESDTTASKKAIHTGLGIALDIGNAFSPGLMISLGTTYALSMENQNSDWQWRLGPQVIFGLFYNW